MRFVTDAAVTVELQWKVTRILFIGVRRTYTLVRPGSRSAHNNKHDDRITYVSGYAAGVSYAGSGLYG